MQENADSNYTIASANKDHTGVYTCTATVTAPGVVQHSVDYSVDVRVRCKLPSFIVSRTSVYSVCMISAADFGWHVDQWAKLDCDNNASIFFFN